MSDNIKVAIRIRPIIEREKNENAELFWTCCGANVVSPYASKPTSFSFDTVFDQTATNSDVFEKVVRPVVDDFLDGYNGTVFAYGQTSSGKTYTMMGNETNAGVIPMTVKYIFRFIEKTPGRTYLLRFSFIEIYNEHVTDLLAENQSPLKIFENTDGMIVITDINERVVTSASDLMQALIEGEQRRHFGETCMNERSSRSHTICKMIIESHGLISSNDPVVVSHLNLVDLAGSEKCGQLNTKEIRFKEGCNINRSLMTLARVISKLSEGNSQHINYRDSKLTRILKLSLGGNSKTTVICNITPAVFDDSLSTLQFAERARAVKNKPQINEILSKDSLLKEYERQIQNLQTTIASLNIKTQQSECFQKKLEERDGYIFELQEKVRTISDKLLVSSRSCSLSKPHSRRETWCGVTASRFPLRRPSLGSLLEMDMTDDLETIEFHSVTNFEQENSLFTNDKKREIEQEHEIDEFLEQIALFNINADDHKEILKQYKNQIRNLKLEIKSLRQDQEEQEKAREESINELTNDKEKIKELLLNLEKQIIKEVNEYETIISDKCQIIEKLQKENESRHVSEQRNGETINNSTNEAEETLKAQFVNPEEKYTALVECIELQFIDEKNLLLQEIEELKLKYSDLRRLKDEDDIRDLVSDLIESLPIANNELVDQITESEKDYEAQIAELQQTIQISEEIIQELRGEIVKLLEEADAEESRKEEMERLKVSLFEAQQQLEKRIESDESLSEHSNLKEENVNMKKEVEKLKVLLTESQQLEESVETKHQQELELIQVKLEQLLQELETEEKIKQAFEQQNFDLKEENFNLQDMVEKLTISSQLESDVLAKNQIELDQLHEKLKQIGEPLENEQKIKKAFEQQTFDLKEENLNLQNIVEKLTKSSQLESDVLAKNQIELDQLHEKLKLVEETLENEQKIKKAFEQQNFDLKEENLNLQNIVEKLTISSQLEDVLAKNQIELDQLHEKLKQVEETLENEQKTKKAIEEQKTAVEEDNLNLHSEVDKLKELTRERDLFSTDAQAKHEMELDQLHEKLKQFEDIFENEQKIKQAAEKQNSDLKEENLNLCYEMGKLKELMSERDQFVGNIQSKHQVEVDQLQEKLENEEQFKKSFERENSRMKEENSNFKNKIDKLKEENSSFQNEIDKLKEEITKYSTECQRSSEIEKQLDKEKTFETQCLAMKEIARLAEEVQLELQTECERLSKSNAELKEKLNHQEQFILRNEEEHQLRISEFEKADFSQKEALEICEIQIFDLLEKDQQYVEKVDSMAKEQAQLEVVISQLERTIDEKQQKYLQELNVKTVELEQCEARISELKLDCNLWLEDLKSKTTELDECKTTLSEVRLEYECVTQDLKSKTNEVEQSKISALEMKLEYESTIQKLNSEIMELKHCQELLREKNLAFELRIQELCKKLDEQDEAKNQASMVNQGFEELKLKLDELQRVSSGNSQEIMTNLRIQNEGLKNHTEALEIAKRQLENELESLSTQQVENCAEKFQLKSKLDELEKQIQEKETENVALVEKFSDINNLRNDINILKMERLNLETQLQDTINQRVELQEGKLKSELEVVTLTNKVSNCEEQIQELTTFINTLETNNNKLEQELSFAKKQSQLQLSERKVLENKILEEKTRTLEEINEKQETENLKLATEHDRQILELKTAHEAEENKMKDRIKFLEDNRDEMEEIVDNSRREMWEMLDEEKNKHKKTKAELDEMKKLLNSFHLSENKAPDNSRNPLHALSLTRNSTMSDEHKSQNEEVNKRNLQLQKPFVEQNSQLSKKNEFADYNQQLLKRDCEINELKLKIKQREAPLIAKNDILNKENNSLKKRLNEMKQEVRRVQHPLDNTTSELNLENKSLVSNFGIVDSTKIELMEMEMAKLKQKLKKCSCMKK